MFFEDISDLPAIASRTNFAIFSANPYDVKPVLKKAFKSNVVFLKPDEKNGKISVEMVRDFSAFSSTIDTNDKYFVVLSAEALNEHAENAFLKCLEEPKPHHHFILVTTTPSALLPTILSRAQVFYLKEKGTITRPIESSEKVKTLARELVTADVKGLIKLSNDLTKKKDTARTLALEVTGCAIEMMYKSYFATNQEKFLKKLPRLLTLYDNLQKNGHVKLHIVADML
ncbi:hypothetical protein IKG20_01025 [Candidatus Saccharibacteria bacterium]|nr:hypothetical protein [Candidatus Saccharibacteria bacterium]